MTDHKELAEKVAKRLCFVAGEASWEKFWEEMAHAVIDIVLEEAALVADRMSREWATEWHRTLKVDEHMEGMSDGADDVAAAIRAMKDKQ